MFWLTVIYYIHNQSDDSSNAGRETHQQPHKNGSEIMAPCVPARKLIEALKENNWVLTPVISNFKSI
jgi:hypothetical protein